MPKKATWEQAIIVYAPTIPTQLKIRTNSSIHGAFDFQYKDN